MDGYTALQTHRYVGDPAASTRDLLDSPEVRLNNLERAGLTAEAGRFKVRLKLEGRCFQLGDHGLALVEKHFPMFYPSGKYTGGIPEDMLDWILEITGLGVFSSIGYLVAPDHGETIVIGTAGPFAETDKPVQYAIAQWGPEIHKIEDLRAADQAVQPQPSGLPVQPAQRATIPKWEFIVPNLAAVSSWPLLYGLLRPGIATFFVLTTGAVDIFGLTTEKHQKCQEGARIAIWVLGLAPLIACLLIITLRAITPGLCE